MELPELIDGKYYAVTAHGVYNVATDSIISDQNNTILNNLRGFKYFPSDFNDLGIHSVTLLPDPLPTENGSIVEDAEGDVLKLWDDEWWHGDTPYGLDDLVQPVTVIRIGAGK